MSIVSIWGLFKENLGDDTYVVMENITKSFRFMSPSNKLDIEQLDDDTLKKIVRLKGT